MGVVYRAKDDTGAEVAIKRLHGDVATSPELVARFQREAAAHAVLMHPNIAALHAVGDTEDGGLFFVMELVDGRGLADLLDEGPVPPQLAIQIGEQVLSALHHAHQFGFVHRDLKPENILLDERGTETIAKVIDFGLVKMLNDVLGDEECRRLTTTGMVFGTPQYMSPEQILGRAVDGRADLYAFGTVLFEMLTLRRPFEEEEITDLWQAHLHEPVPSCAGHVPDDMVADFDAVLGALLAKSADDRFANASAAKRALSSLRRRR
jgi:serine/threonine-protein kinase